MDDDKKDKLAEREAQIEARAAEAYERIFKKQTHWADWMFIADGLMVGRQWAMRKSGKQEPNGKGYILAFSKWMDSRPWARDLDSQTRNDLFWCHEHRSDIEEYRDELPENERPKKNHPTYMKRSYLEDRKAKEAEREDADDEQDEDKPGKRGGPDDTALREEMAKLRADLVAERDAHRKTTGQRDEAYNNPLHVWQTNAEDAAIKLFHDNPQRARTIMRTLMTLMPDDAAVIALALASGQDAKAIIDAKDRQASAARKMARVAARSRKGKTKSDKPTDTGSSTDEAHPEE